MPEVAWQIEHSVETDASHSFAWHFMTDVSNWDDPPARFVLHGPFAAGSEGTTLLPDQEPRRWRIGAVRPHFSYVIETDLKGATLSFEWHFDPVSDGKTRLTQRIMLSGDDAAKHVESVRVGFGSNLAAGMNRIAEAIGTAQADKGEVGLG